MGVVQEFVDSDDAGWDVSRGHFLVQMVDELEKFPDVALVVQGKTMALINRNYTKVQIVTKEDNGSSIE